jgi:hypothetical protein
MALSRFFYGIFSYSQDNGMALAQSHPQNKEQAARPRMGAYIFG